MATIIRHENRDAKRAYAISQACPYCQAPLALGVNLAIERDDAGRVIGACCADCAE